jgi:membrane fusion protein, copper/silver efflux system
MSKVSPSSQGSHPSGHSHGLPRKSAMKGSRPVIYTMTPEAKMLAQVETTEVKREKALRRLRTIGMVEAAETRVATLIARIEGRLDKLFVDFTGVKVNKGDPLVTIWSPALIKSQVELFESIRSGDTEGVIHGAEEKLMQYGLTRAQVDWIRKSGKPDLYITLRAPISGIVIHKKAVLGQFVKQGQEMFVINDLSHVWVQLDAYECDLPWIRYGQNVTFTTPAVPGKTFKGKVIFIDPVLDAATRTVNVRVDVPNPDYELKPNMFVNAELESEVDDHGIVVKPEWIGKYICPYDPTDVSDKPGNCSKPVQCQPEPTGFRFGEGGKESGECTKAKVAMRPATAYGYSANPHPVLPLVIPETAVLFTGKRSIAYVEVPNQPDPTYEQRDVILGPRAGNSYVVYSGLKEGEQVVVRGNFQIDSSVQILGEPSMMNPVESKKSSTVEMPSSHTTPKTKTHPAMNETGGGPTPNMPGDANRTSHASDGKGEK